MKGGICMAIFFRSFRNKKYVKKIRVLVVICVLLLLAGGFKTQIQAKDTLKMYAKSYALTDGKTNRVLVGKNETVPMANASTTKILTCIITLENCGLDEMVEISANAAKQPKVRLGMKEGEEYPLKDLLYGLMLESYNDCAVAIAEHVAGSEAEFSNLLNKKAKDIGCKDTYFLTPNGLDKEDEYGFHHTTAEDLCKMMAYCVWESPKKDVFLEITQMRQYKSFTNRNAFLDQMDGVLSGKTGYTAKAGYCYVAAYEEQGKRYCVSLLACGWPNHKTYKWADTRTLFTYGKEHYDVKIVKLDDIQKEVEITGYIVPPKFELLNQKDSVKIYGKGQKYEVLLGEEEHIEGELVLYDNIQLPIYKNQVLGVCRLYIKDVLLDEIELVAMESADAWKLEKILEVILCQFLTFSY